MKSKAKATRQGGSLENIIAGSNYISDFQFENIAHNAQELQSQIAGHLRQHRTVRKLIRCLGCGQPRNPARMSAISAICKECTEILRSKGPVARNRQIESAKANLGRLLRRCFA